MLLMLFATSCQPIADQSDHQDVETKMKSAANRLSIDINDLVVDSSLLLDEEAAIQYSYQLLPESTQGEPYHGTGYIQVEFPNGEQGIFVALGFVGTVRGYQFLYKINGNHATGQKCTLALGNDGRFLDTNCAVVKDLFVYVDAQYRPSKPPTTYQNDVLGVQVADTMGLRIVEDGRIANDSTWGFALVKNENGGNGALVMSIALVDQAPPDVTQAVTKVVAAYPDLPIQQAEITIDGRPGKMLFPLPGPTGATYIYLATNQQLYRIIYAADTLDATGQALLAQLHFVKPTRTLAALGLKHAADEPIQVTAPVDQALPKGQDANGAITREELRADACIITIVGSVNGTANFEDQSIDGAFATFIYDGGATQAKRIYQGKFTAPILARRCDSGLEPIGFQLTIGEWRQYIKLTGTELALIIQLQSAPVQVENVAEHAVVLGTVSGMVRENGQPVPDGMEVNVYLGGGLQQTVFTHNGVYTAATIGDLSDGIDTYLPVTINIGAVEVNIIPSLQDMVQDVDLP